MVKYTDEQIIPLLKDPQYTSNRQIALALGKAAIDGNFSKRLTELREKHSIPEPIRQSSLGRPTGKDQIDIQLYDTVTKDGVWYRVVDIDTDGFAIRRTDNVGGTVVIRKGDYLAGKTGYKRRDLPPVKTYIDPFVKNERAAIGMEEAYPPPSSFGKPATAAMEPVHIDLEIEDSTDPVMPAVKPEPDYIDPEWFDKPIPRKGTVERAIWDRAYKEICEIQTLRSTIRTALDRGDRLPANEVERYNKYVSRYGEEAGA